MVTAITDGDDRDQTDKAPVDANPASVRFRWAEREQDRAVPYYNRRTVGASDRSGSRITKQANAGRQSDEGGV